ncbi:hypothetical protein BWQ96_09080 [Gracilariopsis chorda]|uniref:Uncharacterized protein n=1 Tax=Gracilariopsis chorda TaxID=448386 RepID=A0A2V3IGK0_9FLOR|nr:hypothetical protein BWQ96_09080 [Gracilariopsis chorda]|eukprot:PXF41225.1 hypothetical protein BWQ96_09080 [Gracilariopsis chorda]
MHISKEREHRRAVMKRKSTPAPAQQTQSPPSRSSSPPPGEPFTPPRTRTPPRDHPRTPPSQQSPPGPCSPPRPSSDEPANSGNPRPPSSDDTVPRNQPPVGTDPPCPKDRPHAPQPQPAQARRSRSENISQESATSRSRCRASRSSSRRQGREAGTDGDASPPVTGAVPTAGEKEVSGDPCGESRKHGIRTPPVASPIDRSSASSASRPSTTTRRRRTFRGSAQAGESFEVDEDVGEKEFAEWFEEDAQESSGDEEEGRKEHEDIDDEDFDPLNYIADEGLSSLDHEFNEANRASARRSCGTSGIPGTAQEERRKAKTSLQPESQTAGKRCPPGRALCRFALETP